MCIYLRNGFLINLKLFEFELWHTYTLLISWFNFDLVGKTFLSTKYDQIGSVTKCIIIFLYCSLLEKKSAQWNNIGNELQPIRRHNSLPGAFFEDKTIIQRWMKLTHFYESLWENRHLMVGNTYQYMNNVVINQLNSSQLYPVLHIARRPSLCLTVFFLRFLKGW